MLSQEEIDSHKNDWGMVENLYNQCLGIAEKINDTGLVAESNSHLGTFLNIQGKYEDAIRYFRIAILRFQQLHDMDGLAEGYNSLGLCHAQLGKWTQAGDYYELSLDYCKKSKNKKLSGNTYIRRAELAIQTFDYKIAKFYCNQAIQVFVEILDREGLADTYQLLGCISKAMNQNAESLVYFDKALEIYREIGDNIKEAETLAEIAKLEQGDKEITKI